MFDHPADLRISQRFNPAASLDDVEAVRQLWAVNFFVTPARLLLSTLLQWPLIQVDVALRNL